MALQEEINRSLSDIVRRHYVRFFEQPDAEGYLDLAFAHGLAGVLAAVAATTRSPLQLEPLSDYLGLLEGSLSECDHTPEFLHLASGTLIHSVRPSWCYGELGMWIMSTHMPHSLRGNLQTLLHRAWNSHTKARLMDISLCHGLAGYWLYSRVFHRVPLPDFSEAELALILKEIQKATDLLRSQKYEPYFLLESAEQSVLEGLSGFVLAYVLSEYGLNALHPFGLGGQSAACS